MALDSELDSCRSFKNDGRDAVTTMRASPDWSSGTLCLPRGREIFSWLGAACVTVAVGLSSEYKGTVRPFCSSTTFRVVKRAFGASATTSSVPAWPIARSGLAIVMCGWAPRPATTYATPRAIPAATISTRSARSISFD